MVPIPVHRTYPDGVQVLLRGGGQQEHAAAAGLPAHPGLLRVEDQLARHRPASATLPPPEDALRRARLLVAPCKEEGNTQSARNWTLAVNCFLQYWSCSMGKAKHCSCCGLILSSASLSVSTPSLTMSTAIRTVARSERGARLVSSTNSCRFSTVNSNSYSMHSEGGGSM